MSESRLRMKVLVSCGCALLCAFIASGTALAQIAPMMNQAGSASNEAMLAAKCKAASYARRPAGQMATTMRELQIQRCIKNGGYLD
jgi:hypothetical protein